AEIDLSLVVTGGAGAIDPAVESVATQPRLRLRAGEGPARRDADPLTAGTEGVDALDRTLLAGAGGGGGGGAGAAGGGGGGGRAGTPWPPAGTGRSCAPAASPPRRFLTRLRWRRPCAP